MWLWGLGQSCPVGWQEIRPIAHGDLLKPQKWTRGSYCRAQEVSDPVVFLPIGNYWNAASFPNPSSYLHFSTFQGETSADISFYFKTLIPRGVFLENLGNTDFIKLELKCEYNCFVNSWETTPVTSGRSPPWCCNFTGSKRQWRPLPQERGERIAHKSTRTWVSVPGCSQERVHVGRFPAARFQGRAVKCLTIWENNGYLNEVIEKRKGGREGGMEGGREEKRTNCPNDVGERTLTAPCCGCWCFQGGRWRVDRGSCGVIDQEWGIREWGKQHKGK